MKKVADDDLLNYEVQEILFGHVFAWDDREGKIVLHIGMDGGYCDPLDVPDHIMSAKQAAYVRLPKVVIPDYSTERGAEVMNEELCRRFDLELIKRARTSEYLRKWVVIQSSRTKREYPGLGIAQDDDPRKACIEAIRKWTEKSID